MWCCPTARPTSPRRLRGRNGGRRKRARHWAPRERGAVMSEARIGATVIGSAIALLALGGCQQHGAQHRQDNRSIVAPAPTPSATPAAKPSPRSIMQPSVEPAIDPPPLQPLDVTIGFPDGGAKLDAAATAALDQLLARPETSSGGPITLRGNTDSRGNDADNKRASKHRAQAVADYLIEKGVDKARLTIVALGEDRPIAPNANLDGSDNEEGRRKNRRVDITVTPALQAEQADAPADDLPVENGAAPADNAVLAR
ncbi:OmpA family protein [Sphingomonas koreensis]|nr:OmpA family protein [Sphingomonas koreensis]